MGKLKYDRQEQILMLIEKYPIGTQQDLVAALINSGFPVTQATVSRDIHELNLRKVREGNSIRYSQYKKDNRMNSETLSAAFKDMINHIDIAQNLVIIHTSVGMAPGLAAMIDRLSFKEPLGCIAGDDTIFVACEDRVAANSFMYALTTILDEYKKKKYSNLD